MRRSLVTTALVLAAGALCFVGCTDSQPPTEPPAESPSFKKGGIPAPQARINALIKDAFDSKADRKDAHKQMARIKNALARGVVGRGQALTRELIRFVGVNADDVNAAADLAAELLAFSGISGTAVVTAGVIGSDGGELISADEQAAISLPPLAVLGDELISFFKKEQPCFPDEEIPEDEQFDDCYTFEPEGLVFFVDVRVEVCLDLPVSHPNVALARLHGRDDPGPPEVLVEEDHQLIDCAGFDAFPPPPVASIGSSGFERFAQAGLNRLIGLFSPEPLFAANALALAGKRLGGARGSLTDIGWALPQLPDLIIESIEVDPTDPTDEDALSFTVTVKNIGTVAADASEVRLTVEEVECGECGDVDEVREVPALDPGESVEVVIDSYDCEGSCDIFLSPSDYVARATADDDEKIDEADEDNNTAELEFTVGLLAPDLIDFETFPGGAPACANCEISNEFASLGVTFSGTPNPTRLRETSSFDPVTGNHSVTAWPGTTPFTMTFPDAPTTVQFTLRANNGEAVFPVSAIDGSEGSVPAGQITRSNIFTYVINTFTFRQETVTVTSPNGISSITIGSGTVYAHWVDDLMITP